MSAPTENRERDAAALRIAQDIAAQHANLRPHEIALSRRAR